jgi:hypothetical protein
MNSNNSEKSAKEIRDERIKDGIENPFTEIDVLRRANIEDYTGFLKTIAYMFDVNYVLVEDLSNYDKLWRPFIEKYDAVNYIQWLTLECDRQDPVYEMLNFLMKPRKDSNSFYELTKKHKEYVLTKYSTYDNYFEEISTRLWKSPDYIKENYFPHQIYDI